MFVKVRFVLYQLKHVKIKRRTKIQRKCGVENKLLDCLDKKARRGCEKSWRRSEGDRIKRKRNTFYRS